MVKILKCYLIPKKSYDTLSKGAIFLASSVYMMTIKDKNDETPFVYKGMQQSFKA